MEPSTWNARNTDSNYNDDLNQNTAEEEQCPLDAGHTDNEDCGRTKESLKKKKQSESLIDYYISNIMLTNICLNNAGKIKLTKPFYHLTKKFKNNKKHQTTIEQTRPFHVVKEKKKDDEDDETNSNANNDDDGCN